MNIFSYHFVLRQLLFWKVFGELQLAVFVKKNNRTPHSRNEGHGRLGLFSFCLEKAFNPTWSLSFSFAFVGKMKHLAEWEPGIGVIVRLRIGLATVFFHQRRLWQQLTMEMSKICALHERSPSSDTVVENYDGHLISQSNLRQCLQMLQKWPFAFSLENPQHLMVGRLLSSWFYNQSQMLLHWLSSV